MAFCVNCGQQIPDGASFCTNCGAPQTTHMQAQAPDQNPFADSTAAGGYGTADSSFGTAGDSAASDGYPGAQSGYTSSDSYAGTQSSYTSSDSYAGTQSSYTSSDSYAGGQTSYSSSDSYAGTQGGNGYGGGPTPGMTFAEAVETCLVKKFVSFSGRARRSEYWYFTLFSLIVSMAASIIGGMLFVHHEGDVNLLSSLLSLVLFLPGLGVAIRRLHDIGKSAWWYLIIFVPMIGWIILLVFMCKDSFPGPNQYGPSPKYPG